MHETPFRERMRALLAEATDLFPARLEAPLMACPCPSCMDDETRRRLENTPRDDWSAGDLHELANSAHGHDARSAEQSRALVPRIMRMLLDGEEPEDGRYVHDSPLHHLGDDRRAVPDAFAARENEVIDGFLTAWCLHHAQMDLACELYDATGKDDASGGDDRHEDWLALPHTLQDATDANVDPVAIAEAGLAACPDAAAFGIAQFLVWSKGTDNWKGKPWWWPVWGDPDHAIHDRLMARFAREDVTHAMERLAQTSEVRRAPKALAMLEEGLQLQLWLPLVPPPRE